MARKVKPTKNQKVQIITGIQGKLGGLDSDGGSCSGGPANLKVKSI